MIVPSHDLVVVRRGFNRDEGGFDIAGFTRDVRGATARLIRPSSATAAARGAH